jgi:hypothetical protein
LSPTIKVMVSLSYKYWWADLGGIITATSAL